MTSPGPHVVKAVSSFGTIQLRDVLFGDVWLCSGQSNMATTVSQAINPNQEIADADNYPKIRVMTVADHASKHPETDIVNIQQHWSVASRASIGGNDWNYFSAVCWFYGKYLFHHRGYPIGLVASDWGGAAIEPWMSPQALAWCGKTVPNPIVIPTPAPGTYTPPNVPTVMWNAMMEPFLKMTIYGVIWFQGESNAWNPPAYKCLFRAMINDWRGQFHQASGGETDAMFPFGFVQLAPFRNGDRTGGYPGLRWAQTANFGFSPNNVLHKVFMAVAMDLPDYSSPYGAIHPRHKKEIGLRLGLAAEAVAYGVPNVHYQGPFPTTISANPTSGILTIEFDSGRTPIDVRNNNGYEVCCSTNVHVQCNQDDSEWKAAPITSHRTSAVDVNYRQHCGNGAHVLGVRYAWRQSPCELKKCAVYSKANSLPAPPYLSLARYV